MMGKKWSKSERATMRLLHDEDHMSLQEIGDIFDLSRERIRQLVGGVKNSNYRSYTKVLHICHHCHKEFFSDRETDYCSAGCRKFKPLGVGRVCRKCGNSFRTKPSYIKRGHGNFCSHSCSSSYYAARSQSKIGWNHHRDKIYSLRKKPAT